jgi:formate dehydrogenase (coenzyme F420) alpha subunit
VLMTGAREALHVNSRFRGVGRPGKAASRPRVDVHPDDAARLGVVDGDVVRITSRSGSLEVPANIVAADELLRGCLQLTQGWGEVNVNLLTDDDRLDPISGFPAVKEVHVRMERVDDQESGGLVLPVDEGIPTDSV